MIYYKSCRTSSRKEVSFMEEILVTFLVSVLAGAVSYYICKWLDGRR
ncbi:molybdenum cofactor biosynthesis protein MoaD [Ruminococcus sp. AM12-48]|nr:molybdenum cofactor biosynthesis protein MoaD [Ruminococcus sp. AM12-48]RHT08631.1 molybdenum cofactor biosynthesis protein MoaD [Ruminococcus sp. AM34-9LB]RHT28000.1 molybdenum cofactor biosynthesis protein MoaD [Ruminococcus sp. AM32-17LB]RHU69912.1 molybdenum cofactor biosynthesis protein MoaD [Ruminococcus sp. TF06-23]